ncbi:MAG TPA: SDR family oxidoreductase [Desulfomonilia bacterium]|jgi:NAD(P)-dependent dehydrogenase (short-subunit alcohol dehydrogenase family)|nr:SDR family oxidoreductase [Deltaproteobacteria bacterium]HRR21176.1 SDR family oxidoreductase [Desulfomonilia bacterium]HRR68623.1 SDR family oxidoreductase [Desulfomonilia bacterium]HRT45924.1 SDR family oxidoreductase [Desulfomonilia bacterium]
MGLLPGKVTVITGAGRGLGKALALRFAREGSSVVLAGRSYDLLEKVCDEIRASGGEGFPVRMDVRDPHSVAQAVEEAASRFGRIDVLINNSGISMVSPSESLSYEDWKNAIDTNLSGVFFCSRAVAMHMIDRGISGCIINISSTFGKTPVPRRAAYCASKAAVDMLTKVLAAEWAEKKIRVNAIAPGYLKTEFIQQLEEQGKLDTRSLKKRIPQGRIGSAEEITGMAVFMAGDEATYMTGSVVYIDGGWTAYGFV